MQDAALDCGVVRPQLEVVGNGARGDSRAADQLALHPRGEHPELEEGSGAHDDGDDESDQQRQAGAKGERTKQTRHSMALLPPRGALRHVHVHELTPSPGVGYLMLPRQWRRGTPVGSVQVSTRPMAGRPKHEKELEERDPCVSSVLASSVAVLLATVAGAGPSAQTGTNGKTAATAPATPKALSATGKIVGFDDATKTLTLSTAKGEEKFVLGSSARLQEGAKTITAANLSGLAGYQAKVRYTASGSDKAAESVMVSGGARAKSSK